MGPLGWPETVFIFFLALILFGPKKLPELGRTVGKALTEFRRASNELKSTFDREMKSLEQETESFREVTNQYQPIRTTTITRRMNPRMRVPTVTKPTIPLPPTPSTHKRIRTSGR